MTVFCHSWDAVTCKQLQLWRNGNNVLQVDNNVRAHILQLIQMFLLKDRITQIQLPPYSQIWIYGSYKTFQDSRWHSKEYDFRTEKIPRKCYKICAEYSKTDYKNVSNSEIISGRSVLIQKSVYFKQNYQIFPNIQVTYFSWYTVWYFFDKNLHVKAVSQYSNDTA